MSLLLMVACLHDVGTLSDAEATALPLPQVVRDVDVVIDLRADRLAQHAELAVDRPGGSVIQADDVDGRAAAPGLLRVLAACPPGPVPVEISLLLVCAQAIVAAVPAW